MNDPIMRAVLTPTVCRMWPRRLEQYTRLDRVVVRYACGCSQVGVKLLHRARRAGASFQLVERLWISMQNALSQRTNDKLEGV